MNRKNSSKETDLENETHYLTAILEWHWNYKPESQPPWIVQGGTALHFAAWNKHTVAVEVLLLHGANIEARDSSGQTPLHLASKAGSESTVAALLRQGAIPQSVDGDLVTPLMAACQCGAEQVIDTLIHCDGDRMWTDVSGQTALHASTIGGNVKIFRRLLNAGWDPYQSDHLGCSSIYYAIFHPRLATYIGAMGLDYSSLLSARWNRKIRSHTASHHMIRRMTKSTCHRYLNEADPLWPTPLIDTAIAGLTESMRVFLRSGADSEVCHPRYCTALIASCKTGQLASVKLLVRNGARLECLQHAEETNAVQAASKHKQIIAWLLVKRYIDQYKITRHPHNGEEVGSCRPWSGIRTVQIPLQGVCERPLDYSLLEHASFWHELSNMDISQMVPLDWNPVPHFLPINEFP